MSGMKAALFALVLLVLDCPPSAQGGKATTTETKPQCTEILRIDWIHAPNTANKATDSAAVCDDGKLVGFHAFTAPAFGAVPPQPTKWDYSGILSRDELADVRHILAGRDIAQFSDAQEIAVERERNFADTMCFVYVQAGKQRSFALRGFLYSSCEENQPRKDRNVQNLICLFGDLYSRAKNGTPPSEGCGCKSLHDISVGE